MFDVALVPADDADQMLPHVFAGRNAADLVGGVGQKGLELGAVLARRKTRPRGGPNRPAAAVRLAVADSSSWRTAASQAARCG